MNPTSLVKEIILRQIFPGYFGDIKSNQFEFDLLSGHAQLSSLVIDTNVINRHDGFIGLPLTLKYGRIGNIKIIAPWLDYLRGIFESSISLSVQDVVLHFKTKNEVFSSMCHQNGTNMEKSIEINKSMNFGDRRTEEDDSVHFGGSDPELFNLDSIIKNLKISIKNVKIKLEFDSGNILVLDMPELQYSDKTKNIEDYQFEMSNFNISLERIEKSSSIFSVDHAKINLTRLFKEVNKIGVSLDVSALKGCLSIENVKQLIEIRDDIKSMFGVQQFGNQKSIKDDELDSLFKHGKREVVINEEEFVEVQDPSKPRKLIHVTLCLSVKSCELSCKYDGDSSFVLSFTGKNELMISNDKDVIEQLKLEPKATMITSLVCENLTLKEIIGDKTHKMIEFGSTQVKFCAQYLRDRLKVTLKIPLINIQHSVGTFKRILTFLEQLQPVQQSEHSTRQESMSPFEQSNRIILEYGIEIDHVKFVLSARDHLVLNLKKINCQSNGKKITGNINSSEMLVNNEQLLLLSEKVELVIRFKAQQSVLRVVPKIEEFISLTPLEEKSPNTIGGFPSVEEEILYNEGENDEYLEIHASRFNDSDVSILLKVPDIDLRLSHSQLICLKGIYDEFSEVTKFPTRPDTKSTSRTDSNPKFEIPPKEEIPVLSLRCTLRSFNFELTDVAVTERLHHNYRFKLKDLLFFHEIETYQSHSHVRAREIHFLDNNVAIFHRCDKLIKEFKRSRMKENSWNPTKKMNVQQSQIPSLVVDYKADSQSQQANVYLCGIVYEHYLKTEDFWVNGLTMLMQSVSSPGGSQEVKNKTSQHSIPLLLKVEVFDFAINVPTPDSNLLLILEGLTFSQTTPSVFDISCRDISVLLSNRVVNLGDIEKSKKSTMISLGFVEDLVQIGCIKVTSLVSLDSKITQSPASYRKNGKTDMEILLKNGKIDIRLCPDSMETLSSIISCHSSAPVTKDQSSSLKESKVVNVQPSFVMKKHLFYEYYMANLDKNAFKPITEKDNRSGQKEEFAKFYPEKDQYQESSLHTDTSMVTTPPKFRLRVVDISVQVELFKGSDWKNERGSDHLTLELSELCFDYRKLRKQNWIMNLSLNDIKLDDHISNSKYRSLLYDLGSVKKRSKIFELNIENVLDEMRLEVSLAPLKLNFHQKAWDLISLYLGKDDAPTTNQDTVEETKIRSQNQSSSSQSRQLYFQRVSIGSIQFDINVSHKLLNVENFLLETKAEVFYGVNGVTELFQLISKIYVSKVLSSSTFLSLVSSQSTINSFILMGTGLADLVLLPIRNAQDGQPLRGFRLGMTSFARNFTMGGVGITLNTVDKTHDILRYVNSQIGNENSVDPFVPHSFKTGTTQAVDRFASGFGGGFKAITEMPSEFETSGTSGVAKKGVQLVIAPLIGSTAGMSKLLYGVKTWIDPEVKEASKKIFK